MKFEPNKMTNKQKVGLAVFNTFVIALLALAIVWLLSSCRSVRVIEKEIIKTDTVNTTKLRIDSIYINDSIYIREFTQGDTVHITTDRWHTRWRDRILYDSIYIAQRDTVTVTTTKEVPRKLNGWQWFQIWTGRLALLAIALAAGVVIIRRRFHK